MHAVRDTNRCMSGLGALSHFHRLPQSWREWWCCYNDDVSHTGSRKKNAGVGGGGVGGVDKARCKQTDESVDIVELGGELVTRLNSHLLSFYSSCCCLSIQPCIHWALSMHPPCWWREDPDELQSCTGWFSLTLGSKYVLWTVFHWHILLPGETKHHEDFISSISKFVLFWHIEVMCVALFFSFFFLFKL